MFSLNDAEENNTLFVNCLLFRCSECLIHLPVLLEMVYVQMPDIEHVILVKLPGTEFCKRTLRPQAYRLRHLYDGFRIFQARRCVCRLHRYWLKTSSTIRNPDVPKFYTTPKRSASIKCVCEMRCTRRLPIVFRMHITTYYILTEWTTLST